MACARTSRAAALVAAWLLLMPAAGCEALHNAGVPFSGGFIDWDAKNAEIEEYRDRYQQDRDPEALRWLLVNHVRQGMSVENVNQILGEEGEREFNDRRFKTRGGGVYRMGDECYRWGPDRDGNAVFLFFRDDQLVNFRPEEYGDALGSSAFDQHEPEE